MVNTNNTYIQTNLLRKDFLAYLIGLTLFICPLIGMAQQQEQDEQDEEEEYYDDRYDRNRRGKIIYDNKNGNVYDAYQQIESKKRKVDENSSSVTIPGGLSLPGFESKEEEMLRNESAKLLQEQGEPILSTDPSKANDKITPNEPDGEQTPSLPSDPDLPVVSGLYYAFAAGILYCSRKIYFNKKAA